MFAKTWDLKWQDVGMATKITICISAQFAGSSLVDLVESIDAQSLPYAEFEVIFTGESSAPERLLQLTQSRPNMVLAPTVESAIERASGQYLLALHPRTHGAGIRLTPEALERLVDRAAKSGASVLLARTVGATSLQANASLFLADQDAVELAQLEQAANLTCCLVQTSLLRSASHPRVGLSEDFEWQLPSGLGSVAILGSYPTVVGADDAPAPPTLTVEAPVVRWHGSTLQVEARGQLSCSPDVDQSELASAVASISIRHLGTDVELWVPTQWSLAPQEPDAASTAVIEASAEIDVATAQIGSPLANGVWLVRLGLYGPTKETSASATIPGVVHAGAMINDLQVCIAPAAEGLGLDVSGVEVSLIGRVPVANTEMLESAAGSLLTIRLPQVHVHGSAAIPGSVVLGKFWLKAQLITDGSEARIESFLSGIAGTSTIATRFGRWAQTGLVLNISELGTMQVQVAPKPVKVTPAKAAAAKTPATTAPAPKPKKPAHKPAANPAPRIGLAATARRKVPSQLEPLVKAVARNKTAKAVYRQLTKVNN